MPRLSAKSRQPEPVPLYEGLSPNQIVAFNLARAREWKNWTQDEAAAALEPYLGSLWSKANYSAAERSVNGPRVRQFDADEIVAFARAFDLPVSWFFLPPPPITDTGLPVKLKTPDAKKFGTGLALLVDLVFGDDHQQALMRMRVDAFLAALPAGTTTDAQRQIARHAEQRVAAVIEHELGDLTHWKDALRSVANHLEDLEERSRRALSSGAPPKE